MADRPIIFSAPMVRALLDGRKTMTRRLVPYGSLWMRVLAGDRLWVRETWCERYFDHRDDLRHRQAFYAADTPKNSDGDRIRQEYGYKWRSPIHMPRWASRLTLIVTATKIERLQEISEADAIAEGIARPGPEHPFGICAREFSELWRSLHGPGSWDSNPEVVALTFTVHRQNIDALPKAEAA